MTAPTPEAPPAPPVVAAPAVVSRSRRQQVRHRHRAATGAARVDRVDRVLLALLGLLAAGLGAVALLAADGPLDLRSPARIHGDAVSSAGDASAAWTVGAVGGGVVLALLGLWWAWAQVRPHPERGRLGPTRIATTRRGHTTLAPAPVARALAADVERIEGVRTASARLVALGPVPEVLLSIEVGLDRDLAVLRADLEEPLARLASALDVPGVDAEVRLRVARQASTPRVR